VPPTANYMVHRLPGKCSWAIALIEPSSRSIQTVGLLTLIVGKDHRSKLPDARRHDGENAARPQAGSALRPGADLLGEQR